MFWSESVDFYNSACKSWHVNAKRTQTVHWKISMGSWFHKMAREAHPKLSNMCFSVLSCLIYTQVCMLMYNKCIWTFFSKIVKKGPWEPLIQKNYRHKKDCQSPVTYARVIFNRKNLISARARAFNVGPA